MAGRKTKRTPEVEKRILDALRVGATQKDAAAAAGIGENTLDEWKRNFQDFRDAVTRAEGACAARMAARIYQEATASEGDWRAAESWLKRRRRNEWGDNVSVDTDREIERLLAQLAETRQGETAGPTARVSRATTDNQTD